MLAVVFYTVSIILYESEINSDFELSFSDNNAFSSVPFPIQIIWALSLKISVLYCLHSLKSLQYCCHSLQCVQNCLKSLQRYNIVICHIGKCFISIPDNEHIKTYVEDENKDHWIKLSPK